MRSADEHLTPQEIDQLLFGADDSKDNAGGGAAPEAQQHLSGCAVCQSVARKYTKADSLLTGLSSGNKSLWNLEVGDKLSGDQRRPEGPKRGRDCPADETWPNLAVGLIREEEAAHYVAHAVQCGWCGQLLKESMEDLAQDATPEEQEALEKLPSASPGWQRAMAKKMAAASGNANATEHAEVEKPAKSEKLAKSKEKAGFIWWPKLVWAGSGLAVVLVAVLVGIRLTREQDVNQLLAQTYTKQRTIELRMSGAEYGRMRVQRGGDLDLPAEFYRAEDIIKTQSAKHPEDPKWLQAQARAHMLEWDYDKAIPELDHALTLKPDDPGLLLDKATALAQRAEKNGPFDLGQALEDLGKVLQKNPDDKIALFNRAIILEKMQSPNGAIADLQRYLDLEPTGPWAEEARRRLDELRKKSTSYRQRTQEPLLEPPAIIKQIDPGDESTWTVVDSRIEDYLDRATDTWLPAAFSVPSPDTETPHALQLLALIAKSRHGDQWLTEMLQMPPSQTSSQALTALREAIFDSRKGEIEAERVAALRASRLFAMAGSKAGKARADAELEYVFHRTSDAQKCLKAATQLAGEIRGRHYAWLDSYLLMEQAVGFALNAQARHTQQALAAAVRKTSSDRYGTSYLRAIGMEASFKMTEGDIVEGWARDILGLSQYWNGVFPPLRAYQFYADLAIAAEAQGYWHLAYLLRKEASEANELTGDHARGRVAYFAVVQAARMAGLNREADDALLKTTAEIKFLPDNKITRMYPAYNQLELAKLDGQTQQSANGLALLEAIEPLVQQSDSFPLIQDFYSTQGNLRLALNRVGAAKDSFHQALRAAQAELASIDDPRDRLAWQKSTDDLYHTFIELQLNDGNAQEALTLLEWHRGAVFPDIEQPLPSGVGKAASLVFLRGTKPVQLLQQPRVVYAVFPRQLAIFVSNQGKLAHKIVPLSSAALERMVQQFYAQCSDPLSDLEELRKNSRQLYDRLIAPVESYLAAGQSVMIEPEGILKQVPFSALVNSKQQYLGDTYFVHLIPGMAYLSHLRNAGVITPRTKGLFVGVSASPSASGRRLPAVPNAEKEARNLGAKFLHARVFTGKDAEIFVIERELAEAELFHFAGHALTTGDNLTLLVASGMKGEPGYLDSTRLRQLQLKRLQLVVLSGCSTGVERDQRLPQLDRMVEVFLEKGVPQVVASLWDVDTLATADTMESFYDEMAGSKPVAASLQASARLIRSAPATRHPYYWAGFEIFGGSQ
jgi:CHAT domain-containing protein